MNKPIKAIIFDADGMVINGERFSNRFSQTFGVPLEKISAFFEKEFKDCILGKKDLKSVIGPYFKDWNWTGTFEELLMFWFGQSYKVDNLVIEKALEFKSQGKTCVLAINQDKYRTSYIKEEMGLGKVFDFIISSSDIGFKKPQKEFFDEIIKKLPNIKKEEVLFFDDRVEHIKAAKEYGFNAKQYTNIKDLQNGA